MVAQRKLDRITSGEEDDEEAGAVWEKEFGGQTRQTKQSKGCTCSQAKVKADVDDGFHTIQLSEGDLSFTLFAVANLWFYFCNQKCWTSLIQWHFDLNFVFLYLWLLYLDTNQFRCSLSLAFYLLPLFHFHWIVEQVKAILRPFTRKHCENSVRPFVLPYSVRPSVCRIAFATSQQSIQAAFSILYNISFEFTFNAQREQQTIFYDFVFMV